MYSRHLKWQNRKCEVSRCLPHRKRFLPWEEKNIILRRPLFGDHFLPNCCLPWAQNNELKPYYAVQCMEAPIKWDSCCPDTIADTSQDKNRFKRTRKAAHIVFVHIIAKRNVSAPRSQRLGSGNATHARSPCPALMIGYHLECYKCDMPNFCCADTLVHKLSFHLSLLPLLYETSQSCTQWPSEDAFSTYSV